MFITVFKWTYRVIFMVAALNLATKEYLNGNFGFVLAAFFALAFILTLKFKKAR